MPFVAALPARKSDHPKHGGRVAGFATCFDGTCHGTLSVYTPGKPTAEYRVTRVPCDFAGAGYRCVKAAGGTDPEADCYDVFLSDSGDRDDCDCKGFTRYGYCVHVDGLRAVIEKGALHLPGFDAEDLANPEADFGPAESDDWAAGIAPQYEDAWGDVIATTAR